MKTMWEEGEIKATTRCWAQGLLFIVCISNTLQEKSKICIEYLACAVIDYFLDFIN